MSDPWQSERLIYRAPEQPDDEDFFLSIATDAVGFTNANGRMAAPQGRRSAQRYLKTVVEDTMLGVVICLKPTSPAAKPVPVGCIHLDLLPSHLSQHRHTELGIDIAKEHQNHGYGSEAIRWALQWAFLTAGMHRVGICAFGYNPGAVRLYERLGFKHEGISRDYLWHNGQWWDEIRRSMLENDWRALRK